MSAGWVVWVKGVRGPAPQWIVDDLMKVIGADPQRARLIVHKAAVKPEHAGLPFADLLLLYPMPAVPPPPPPEAPPPPAAAPPLTGEVLPP